MSEKHITLDSRKIPLMIKLNDEFEKVVNQYIDSTIYESTFLTGLHRLNYLNSKMDLVSSSKMTEDIYKEFCKNFINYATQTIYQSSFDSTNARLALVLSKSRSQEVLSPEHTTDVIDDKNFKTNKMFFESLWGNLQKKMDLNEKQYVKSQIYQSTYETNLAKFKKIEDTIIEAQAKYEWHIYKFLNPNNQKEKVLKTVKVDIPEGVDLRARAPSDNETPKLSWFKLLCIKILSYFASPKETHEVKAVISQEDSLNTIIQSSWNKIDYSNFNSACQEKMNAIKLIIDQIDFDNNNNLSVSLEVKNTVSIVLPKLVSIFNSVKDKDAQDENQENAHSILENSLVAISSYFDTLKKEQKEENVHDIKVYGEFIKNKYLKAGM